MPLFLGILPWTLSDFWWMIKFFAEPFFFLHLRFFFSCFSTVSSFFSRGLVNG
jgi:hypothetical protein